MKFADNIIKDLLSTKEKVGRGSSRIVYGFRWDPTLVLKIAKDDPSQNIMEWQFWDAAKETERAKWLAPCDSITTCGRILLQKRVEPFKRSEPPKELPSFLHHDMNFYHFGWYEGRIVCCDYGLSHWEAEFSLKMKEVPK